MRIKISKPSRYATATGALMLTMGAALFGLAEYAAHLPAPVRVEGAARPMATVTVRPVVTGKPVVIDPTAHRVVAALNACDGIGPKFYVPCLILALRPAQTHRNASGSVISNPAGWQIVTDECRSDSTLSPSELMACLTQPTI